MSYRPLDFFCQYAILELDKQETKSQKSSSLISLTGYSVKVWLVEIKNKTKTKTSL